MTRNNKKKNIKSNYNHSEILAKFKIRYNYFPILFSNFVYSN